MRLQFMRVGYDFNPHVGIGQSWLICRGVRTKVLNILDNFDVNGHYGVSNYPSVQGCLVDLDNESPSLLKSR